MLGPSGRICYITPSDTENRMFGLFKKRPKPDFGRLRNTLVYSDFECRRRGRCNVSSVHGAVEGLALAIAVSGAVRTHVNHELTQRLFRRTIGAHGALVA